MYLPRVNTGADAGRGCRGVGCHAEVVVSCFSLHNASCLEKGEVASRGRRGRLAKSRNCTRKREEI